MPEEKIDQEFGRKQTDEMKNYLIEERNQNKLMTKKHKTVCRVLNYTEHLLIITSPVSRCISVSSFASLIGIPIGITTSTIKLNICGITTRFKNFKSKN